MIDKACVFPGAILLIFGTLAPRSVVNVEGIPLAAMQDVFLGLGGNIGDTRVVLREVLSQISCLSGVFDVQCSPLYRTSPVSLIPQCDYVNAVCRLTTSRTHNDLFDGLRIIESFFGERGQVKNAPRVVDIDILFFGDQISSSDQLQIPHPRWQERLFVLQPLGDLVSYISLSDGSLFDIAQMVQAFPLRHEQIVWLIEEPISSSFASNTMVGTA